MVGNHGYLRDNLPEQKEKKHQEARKEIFPYNRGNTWMSGSGISWNIRLFYQSLLY